MKETLLDIDYGSLGKILDALKNHPTVQSSDELKKSVDNALLFHASMEREISDMVEKHNYYKYLDFFRDKRIELDRNEQELLLLKTFRAMKLAGISLALAGTIAKQSDLDAIMEVRLLSTTFPESSQLEIMTALGRVR